MSKPSTPRLMVQLSGSPVIRRSRTTPMPDSTKLLDSQIWRFRLWPVFGILRNDQYGTVSVGSAGGTHGAHDLAKEAAPAASAHNEKLGVPTLLDEHLSR